LNILSGISFDEFKSAVYNGDINRLHSISGIGTKTAKRLVLEFKDKITNTPTETGYPEDTASVAIADSLEAINNPGTARPFPIMWSQPL
jgi:Holliday junction DNA helicase RuvA